MILTVDIGNTNIFFGVYNNDKLEFFFRVQSDSLRTTDEYATTILSLIEHNGLTISTIKGVIISSVVPQLCFTITRFVRRYLGIEALIVKNMSNLGLHLDVDNPKEVGSDRIVNAIAAINIYGTPAIIVDFGTATTLDVVNIRGSYIGGVICPGIKLSATVLHQKTAALPEIDILKPKETVGKNTIHSMQSGIYYGYLEMINGLINRVVNEEFNNRRDDVNIILTGGLGSIFVDDISNNKYEPYLTLHGLNYIYRKYSN